jgi:DNA gyrase inhibitor GyrI
VGPDVYRAGVAVAEAPSNLPAGLQYEKLSGGKYSRFTLTGSYAQLPQACGRIFTLASEGRLPLRDDFNIENYVNDPRTTPEEQLITEIMLPVD